jgi:hypothetical protein
VGVNARESRLDQALNVEPFVDERRMVPVRREAAAQAVPPEIATTLPMRG